MSEPLLTLAATPDGLQGALRMNGISPGKQSIGGSDHPFSRLLAGHTPGAGEGQESGDTILPTVQPGKSVGQLLAADGKELPDAARLLALAGLVLEDGEAMPLPASGQDGSFLTDATAPTLAEDRLSMTDPAVSTTVAPAPAWPASLEAVAGEPVFHPGVVPGSQAAASRPLTGAEWRLSAEAAASSPGQPGLTASLPVPTPAQATLLDTEAPPMPMPEQDRVVSAVQQALQQRAGDAVARDARFGDLMRIATTPGAEPAARAETLAGFGPQTGANTHPLQAPALPATSVAIPLRQSGWDQALGEQVRWMVGSRLQGAEIRLNPAHLGPLEVRIQIQNDQANINFTAQHGMVREALEAAIPRLREMLGESGLQLNNVTVSDQSLAEQRRQEGRAAFADQSNPGGDVGVEEDAQVLSVSLLREGAGTIDYFA